MSVQPHFIYPVVGKLFDVNVHFFLKNNGHCNKEEKV